MRRAWLVAALAMAVASATVSLPAAAGQAPLAASSTRLAGVTTITWQGTAGIRLQVPYPAELIDGDVDLYLRGGTYAFVRLLPSHGDARCPADAGPYCDAWQFSLIRGLTDDPALGAAPTGRRHFSGTSLPPVWHDPRMDAYLFTDGRATLTMRFHRIPGGVARTASGRVRGTTRLVTRHCLPTPCAATPVGSQNLTYGGETHDVGKAGWIDVVAFSADSSRRPTHDALRGVSACLRPNGLDPGAPAAATSYRFGCLRPEASPTDSGQRALDAATAVGVLSSTARYFYWSGAHGPQYAGFSGQSFGATDAATQMYGTWFSYGIS